MLVTKAKRQRSRALVVLLLPVLVFLGVVGWCIYTLGNEGKNKQEIGHPEKDYLTFLPVDFEEQKRIENR